MSEPTSDRQDEDKLGKEQEARDSVKSADQANERDVLKFQIEF